VRARFLVVLVAFLVCLGTASASELRFDAPNCASDGNIQPCTEAQHMGIMEKVEIKYVSINPEEYSHVEDISDRLITQQITKANQRQIVFCVVINDVTRRKIMSTFVFWLRLIPLHPAVQLVVVESADRC
jgi:hypothetical protein